MYRSSLLLVTLLLFGCGGDDATPKNAVPANSAAVKIDGVALPLDASRSEAYLEASTGDLYVVLQTSQANGSRVLMRLAEFQKRPQKFNLASQSLSRIDLIGPPNSSEYYGSRSCNPIRREIEILTYDEARRTVSGRFSATMCPGIGSTTSKAATDGEFNLPFRVQ